MFLRFTKYFAKLAKSELLFTYTKNDKKSIFLFSEILPFDVFRCNFTACLLPTKDLKIRERTIQVKISPGDILRGHHHRHMPSCPLCITRLWILLQIKKYSVFFFMGTKVFVLMCLDVILQPVIPVISEYTRMQFTKVFFHLKFIL